MPYVEDETFSIPAQRVHECPFTGAPRAVPTAPQLQSVLKERLVHACSFPVLDGLIVSSHTEVTSPGMALRGPSKCLCGHFPMGLEASCLGRRICLGWVKRHVLVGGAPEYVIVLEVVTADDAGGFAAGLQDQLHELTLLHRTAWSRHPPGPQPLLLDHSTRHARHHGSSALQRNLRCFHRTPSKQTQNAKAATLASDCQVAQQHLVCSHIRQAGLLHVSTSSPVDVTRCVRLHMRSLRRAAGGSGAP